MCSRSSKSITNSLPRRPTPVTVAPSIAVSGGSKLRSALIPGVSADSTSAPVIAAPIRRAVISTSGSSGIATTSVLSGRSRKYVGDHGQTIGIVQTPSGRLYGPGQDSTPMSDILAIFGPNDTDSELLTEIERLHPDRVTVLIEGVET